MSLRRLLKFAALAAGAVSVLAKEESPIPPEVIEDLENEPVVSSSVDVKVHASFPQSEIFGVKLVNDHPTQALLTFSNEEKEAVNLMFVGGSLWAPDPLTNGETSKVVRNLTSSRYNLQIPAGESESISYEFSTTMHPQELRLAIMAIVTTEKGAIYSLNAYNETVSVVEPDASLFDPQLIFLYLMLLGLFVGSSYFIYNTWIATLFPQKTKSGKGGDRPRKSTGGAKKEPTSPALVADGAVATGSKAYDESWIPDHHINRPEARRLKSGGTGAKAKAKGKGE